MFARGDYYVPLATTEAALVASYSRGSHLLTEAGGCTAALLNEGVSRAPGFAFRNLREAGVFTLWATEHFEDFRKVAEATTRFGKLSNLRVTVDGNYVFLNFEYVTADACGQNMVTLATAAVCEYIEQQCPIRPRHYFLEANLSGDKKASAQSFLLVRGRKVSAEATLSAELIRKLLRTTPEHLVNFWRMSAMGGVLSGTMGLQGHYANGLAALYLACGQDVACVAESAVGVTRFEVLEDGSLYASVTLPNIMVGTVGGGTGLPSQKACLEVLGLYGPGKAQALAEVCAGLCLAGELSIMGAFCSGDFSRAHKLLGARQIRKAGTNEGHGTAHGVNQLTGPGRQGAAMSACPSSFGRWWIYQRERFPILAHGVLIAAFSSSAVCYSSRCGGRIELPALLTVGVAFGTAFSSSFCNSA